MTPEQALLETQAAVEMITVTTTVATTAKALSQNLLSSIKEFLHKCNTLLFIKAHKCVLVQ